MGVHVAAEWRGHPVDAGEKAEVAEPEAGLGEFSGSDPGVARHPDTEIIARHEVRLDEAVAEVGGEAGHQIVAGVVDRRLFFAVGGGVSR